MSVTAVGLDGLLRDMQQARQRQVAETKKLLKVPAVATKEDLRAHAKTRLKSRTARTKFEKSIRETVMAKPEELDRVAVKIGFYAPFWEAQEHGATITGKGYLGLFIPSERGRKVLGDRLGRISRNKPLKFPPGTFYVPTQKGYAVLTVGKVSRRRRQKQGQGEFYFRRFADAGEVDFLGTFVEHVRIPKRLDFRSVVKRHYVDFDKAILQGYQI
jgi:hypothetical protein